MLLNPALFNEELCFLMAVSIAEVVIRDLAYVAHLIGGWMFPVAPMFAYLAHSCIVS